MLRLHHIHKVFNDDTPDRKEVMHDFNLSLAEEDFVTVIGSNGAGKSTLMNIISGSISVDEGDIEIAGKCVSHLPEAKRAKYLGRVFQDPISGTAPDMTIEENLSIAYCRNKKRTLRKGLTKNKRDFFKDNLQRLQLNLENRLTTQVGLLSGGERQALSLLMATFTKPNILLLDEHTAALDPSRAELVSSLTAEMIAQDQLTTIMVTHNMQQALDLGNRLIMLHEGKIIFEASGEKKLLLTINDLLHEFQKIRGNKILDDKTLLI